MLTFINDIRFESQVGHVAYRCPDLFMVFDWSNQSCYDKARFVED